MKTLGYLLVLVLGLGMPGAAAAAPAFQNAVGFGAQALGGRGGRVIAVTNLLDRGAGSFRACVEAVGPRICIFRVGGVIRFTRQPPVIKNPYLTIAGQTAPGGGILLAHSGGASGFTPLLIKNTHDIVVRHVRVRPDRVGADAGANDAFTIEHSSNVILDHVSGSWALDENYNGHADTDLVTVSWSIFAEGIKRHDKCALIASDPTKPLRISFIGNLCAHNGDRNPDVNVLPGSCVEVVNNVVYNAESQFAEIWETYGGSPVNIVGNYFKAGPDTVGIYGAIDREVIGSTGRARIYANGNQVEGKKLVIVGPRAEPVIVPAPVCPLTVTPLPAATAYARVLEVAGAFPRDSFDRRIVGEVGAGTGHLVSEPGQLPMIANGTPYADTDNDGMSDAFERSHGFDPVRDDSAVSAGNGLTRLDLFLDYAHARVIAGMPVD